MEEKKGNPIHSEQPVYYPSIIYPTQDMHEDEIDLIELWQTIYKHKIFIILFTSFIVILSIIYIISAKPIYKVTANVKLGYVRTDVTNNKSDKYILDPHSVVVYIKNNFNNTKHYPKIDINIVKGSRHILQLDILDFSNASAVQYLKKIMNSIKNKEKKHITAYINNTDSEINILNNQIGSIQSQLKILTQQLKKTKDPTAYQILLLSISQCNQNILDLRLQASKLEEKISPLNITEANIIGKIIENNAPYKPKKKLIVVVAFITGLFLSIFLVFFIEFIKTANRKTKEKTI